MSGEEQRPATPRHVHEWSPTGLDWPADIFTCTGCGLTGDRAMWVQLDAWEAFAQEVAALAQQAREAPEKDRNPLAGMYLQALGERAYALLH